MGFTFFCYSVQMLTKVNGRLLEVKPCLLAGWIAFAFAFSTDWLPDREANLCKLFQTLTDRKKIITMDLCNL